MFFCFFLTQISLVVITWTKSILGGIITVLMSYNALVNIGCHVLIFI